MSLSSFYSQFEARTYNTFITESSMHNRSSLLHMNGHGHYLGPQRMSRRRAMGIKATERAKARRS